MSFNNNNNNNSLIPIGEVGYTHDYQMPQKELQCLKLYFLGQNILSIVVYKVFPKRKETII